jgi:hypothetical protein
MMELMSMNAALVLGRERTRVNRNTQSLATHSARGMDASIGRISAIYRSSAMAKTPNT